MSVLVRLFKTCCCPFYGSQMWQVNSQYINRVCTSWNKGVRCILKLPHEAHTWLFFSLAKKHRGGCNCNIYTKNTSGIFLLWGNSMSLTVILLSIYVVTVLIFFIILVL